MKRFSKRISSLAIIFTMLMAIVMPTISHARVGSIVQVIFRESNMGSYTITGGTTEYTTSHQEDFELNESVTVTATPNADFTFVGWFNCEEYDMNGQGTMGWRTVGDALTTNTSYTFEASEYFYYIMPVFRSSAGHNNIWATDGGEIAVDYPASDDVKLHGDCWVERGHIVDYRIGDEITVKARAKDGYRFIGWFITDPQASVAENYVRDPMISSESEYTYKPGITTIDGVDEPLNYITAAFEEIPEQVEYVVPTEDGSMIATFTFDEGHEFFLNVFEIMGMSAEEIESATGVSASEVERIRNLITENVKEYGDVIAVYGITIDEPDVMSYSEALKLKIKLTDLMKKYNTLKFIFIDDDDNFVVKEVKDVVLGDEYGEVNLDHLSAYALVGSNTEEESKSVKAGDMLAIWVSLGVLSITVMAIVIRKRK